jgi:hypothetical protein
MLAAPTFPVCPAGAEAATNGLLRSGLTAGTALGSSLAGCDGWGLAGDELLLSAAASKSPLTCRHTKAQMVSTRVLPCVHAGSQPPSSPAKTTPSVSTLCCDTMVRHPDGQCLTSNQHQHLGPSHLPTFFLGGPSPCAPHPWPPAAAPSVTLPVVAQAALSAGLGRGNLAACAPSTRCILGPNSAALALALLVASSSCVVGRAAG